MIVALRLSTSRSCDTSSATRYVVVKVGVTVRPASLVHVSVGNESGKVIGLIRDRLVDAVERERMFIVRARAEVVVELLVDPRSKGLGGVFSIVDPPVRFRIAEKIGLVRQGGAQRAQRGQLQRWRRPEIRSCICRGQQGVRSRTAAAATHRPGTHRTARRPVHTPAHDRTKPGRHKR